MFIKLLENLLDQKNSFSQLDFFLTRHTLTLQLKLALKIKDLQKNQKTETLS